MLTKIHVCITPAYIEKYFVWYISYKFHFHSFNLKSPLLLTTKKLWHSVFHYNWKIQIPCYIKVRLLWGHVKWHVLNILKMIHMVHSQDNFVIEVCQLIHFSLDTHSNSICTNRSPTSNIDAFDFPMADENIGLNQLSHFGKQGNQNVIVLLFMEPFLISFLPFRW